MKSDEFKKILKPLIREAVREVILDEGILSNIVAEVAQGLQGEVLTESRSRKQKPETDYKQQQDLERDRQERIRKLNESSNLPGVFSGTKEISDSNGQGPLSGISPGDQGVDITAIQKIANGKWNKLI
tara:strand:- start:147 stop:530 length:384 start_codon:yes stop_codon:yes gene_type:complete